MQRLVRVFCWIGNSDEGRQGRKSLHPLSSRSAHQIPATVDRCRASIDRIGGRKEWVLAAMGDVREPQKVERLRFAKAALLSIMGRMSAELDEARLVRMQR